MTEQQRPVYLDQHDLINTSVVTTTVVTSSADFVDGILPKSIFNTQKSDYETTPIFFGQAPGLIDSINKRYPKLWTLYKSLKNSDWDETEFDYGPCNTDFKTCPRSSSEIMLRQLGWQWQGDSIAARSVMGVLAPVLSSSEVSIGYGRIVDNENVHGLTYSEIVRMSFDNPDQVIQEIMAIQESQVRMRAVALVMDRAYQLNHQYALDGIYSQELYEATFMFVVAMYALERLQFMASFAITFALVETGYFQPIGNAVQKIAKDELEYHAPYGAEVLRIELATERGQLAFKNKRAEIVTLLNEIATGEHSWVDYSFSEGRSIKDRDPIQFKNWVGFCAFPVFTFFGMEDEAAIPLIKSNPMPLMDDWLNIDNNQGAPQETHGNNYKVNIVSRRMTDTKYAFAYPGQDARRQARELTLEVNAG